MHDDAGNFIKVRDKLTQELRREPTDEEIAKEIGISPKKARNVRRAAYQKTISLDRPVGGREDGEALEDFIADEDNPSPLEVAHKGQLKEKINEVFETVLTPRQAMVLNLRFARNGYAKHTLEETGKRLGVTRERARQIEAAGIGKLRTSKYFGELHDFFD
jgi:RNA polymerase primary sigma factor